MAQKIAFSCRLLLLFFLPILQISCMNEEKKESSPTPKQAFQMIREGNERFVQDKLIHPNRSDKTRAKLVEVQRPFAVILSCSDSRASPEIIFDQGIGDLFVVRIAGNVADELQKESILFAVKALKAPLVVVLGHQNCGAIQAFLQGNIEDIPDISKQIAPALFDLPKRSNDKLKEAILANVAYVRDELTTMSSLHPLIKDGSLMIVGGYYDFESGKVEWLKDNPQ